MPPGSHFFMCMYISRDKVQEMEILNQKVWHFYFWWILLNYLLQKLHAFMLLKQCMKRPISTQRTNTLTVFLEKFSNLNVVFYNSLTSGELGIFSNMIWTSAFSVRCSLHVFLGSYLSIPYCFTGALVIVWTLMVSFVFQIPCIIFFQYMYIHF